MCLSVGSDKSFTLRRASYFISLSNISCMRRALFLMFIEAKLPVNLLHYRHHIVKSRLKSL